MKRSLGFIIHKQQLALIFCLSAVVLAVSVPICVGLVRTQRNCYSDDAYITLTYAKNIAEGKGFIYNHPPATLGTTTPLSALLIGSLSWITGIPVHAMAVLVSIISRIGVCALVILCRRRIGISLAGAACVLVVLSTSRLFRFDGEDSILFFLLVSACLLFGYGRYFAAGLTGMLAFLARGEGGLILAVLGTALAAEALRKRDQNSLKNLSLLCCGAGLVGTVWSLYAWRTFGAILPNTLEAKHLQLVQGLAPVTYVQGLWRTISRWECFTGRDCWYLNSIPWSVLGVVFLMQLGYTGSGILSAFRGRPFLLYLLIWAVLYNVLLCFMVPSYPWYTYPGLWVLMLVTGVGCGVLLDWALQSKHILPRRIVLATLAVYLVCRMAMFADYCHAYAASDDVRSSVYKDAAAWLNKNTDANSSVACEEIGYLGYFGQNRIVDLYGLIDPVILAKRKAAGKITHDQIVGMVLPDYYMAPVFMEDCRKPAEHTRSFGASLYRLQTSFHGLSFGLHPSQRSRQMRYDLYKRM